MFGYSVNAYKDMYYKFLTELARWSENGEEPEDVTKDVRIFLDAQEKRLKKFGFTMPLELSWDKEETSEHRRRGGVYEIYAWVKQKIRLLRQGKRFYKYHGTVSLYAVIWDPEKGAGFKDTLYSCPNCGAPETLEHLSITGCSYCQTRFEMGELFPKIMGFFVTDASRNSNAWNRLMIASAVTGVLVLWADCLRQILQATGSFPVEALVLAVAGAPVAAMLAVFIVNLLTFLGGIIYGLIRMPSLLRVTYSIHKVRKALRRADPNYSYEYIEAKAMGLLQMIVFEEAPLTLSIYCPEDSEEYALAQVCDEEQNERIAGEAGLGPFASILSLDYGGRFGIHAVEEQNGLVILDLVIDAKVFRLKRGKAKRQKTRFRLRMAHGAGLPVRPYFSIHLVSCKNCGASFDAYRQRSCPYCGTPYALHMDDWIVLSCQEIE